MRDRWFNRMVYREWLANRTAHVIVIGVIALTFLMYSIYGAWADDDLTTGQARTLNIGAPLLVYYPEWAVQFSRPEFSPDDVADAAGVSRMRPGVVTHLVTPAGVADAWGIDLQDTRLLTTFDTEEGFLPESGANEVAISSALAADGNLTVGDEILLSHTDTDSAQQRSRVFTVSGVISVDDAWSRLVLGGDDQLAELAQLPRFNAAWIWTERTRRGRQVMDAPPAEVVTAELPRVRAPAYPYEVSPLAEKEGVNNPQMQTFGGVPSPFLNRVTPVVWHSDAVRDQVAAMGRTGVASVSGLVTLMFLMVALALTLTVLIVVLDRQRIIGTYAVLGMSSEDIGRMFRSQLIIDAAAGTVTGFLLFVVIALVRGLGTAIPALTIILWLLFQVVLVCWGGRVAWVLSGDRDLRSHLRGDSNFDWWKLIDIFPRPVGPEERRSEGQ